MSWNNQTQPQWGQPPVQPTPPGGRPGWTRKRVIIPSAIGLLVVGSILGSSGSGDTKPVADAKPAPTVTVTITAKPAEKAGDKEEPKPAVTVTKTVTAKPKAKPKPKEEEAPKGRAVFKVWGTAPNGVSVTYGSDSENLDGSGLPMEKTLKVKDGALYYTINAQLQGGGDIQCSVTIDGETKKGRARGEYNICMAQLNGDFFGGFS